MKYWMNLNINYQNKSFDEGLFFMQNYDDFSIKNRPYNWQFVTIMASYFDNNTSKMTSKSTKMRVLHTISPTLVYFT